ncbi:MAG: isoprenylcysteine carboxylmethyltransferase family protein [Pirellulales bacterium]
MTTINTNHTPTLPQTEMRFAVSHLLDITEKVVLITFFGYFLIPIIEAVWNHIDLGCFLLAISESLVVLLVIIRKRAKTFSQNPLDWTLAFGATLTPTLVRPDSGIPSLLTNFAVFIMILGIGLQIYAKYILGRRFGVVAANRGICDRGPYAIVRHPIYLGYLLAHCGFLITSFSVWNLSMYAMTYIFMVPRLFAEERLLKADPEYAAYCSHTKFRLIPGLF